MTKKADRIIYTFFRPDNGEPFYVGKGYVTRPKEHFKKSNLRKVCLKNHLIKKFLAQGLEIPIVVVRENITTAQANEAEVALIKAIGRYPNGPLANMTDGGEGVPGRVLSDKEKDRLREVNLGKKASKETRAKMSKARKGVVPNWSEDGKDRILAACRHPNTLAKIVASNTGKKRSGRALENIRAAPHPGMTGKHHTDEAKELCRQVNLGRKLSDETKQLLREVRLGKKASDKTRAKLSLAQTGQPFHQDPEYRAKLSAALTGRSMSDEARAKMREAWVRRRARQEAA